MKANETKPNHGEIVITDELTVFRNGDKFAMIKNWKDAAFGNVIEIGLSTAIFLVEELNAYIQSRMRGDV